MTCLCLVPDSEYEPGLLSELTCAEHSDVTCVHACHEGGLYFLQACSGARSPSIAIVSPFVCLQVPLSFAGPAQHAGRACRGLLLGQLRMRLCTSAGAA